MAANGFAVIKNSPVSGRGLFATKDLQAGELIFSIERPLVCVLDGTHLDDTCANCFVSSQGPPIGRTVRDVDDVQLKACARCKQMKFCGKKCQTRAWKRFHKFECNPWSATDEKQSKDVPVVSRAVMDLLSRKSNDSISDSQWVELLKLQSHYKELRSERKKTVDLYGSEAWFQTKDRNRYSSDFACQLAAMIMFNSLTLVTPTLEPLGVCLDPFATCANHSCSPNTFAVMDGAQLSFRTLNIVKNDEEIFISYIDTTNSFSRRQFELKDRYMFTCRCNKCRRGPTLQEDSLLVPVNEVSQRIEKSVRDAPDLGVMVPSALANGDYSHSVGEIEDTVSKCIEDCEKEGDPDKAYVHLNSTIQILAERGAAIALTDSDLFLKRERGCVRQGISPDLLALQRAAMAWRKSESTPAVQLLNTGAE